MSLELTCTDAPYHIKAMDTSGIIEMRLSQNSINYDLTDVSKIAFKIGDTTGFLLEIPIDLTTILDKTEGLIQAPLGKEVMDKLKPNEYQAEAWVTSGTDNLIFPSDGVLQFTVNKNIQS